VGEENKCVGFPTEGALISLGESLISSKLSEQVEKAETLYTLHFTSERKCMSVLVKNKSKNENLLLCKGAGEVVLKNSSKFIN
jgi:magnesium-transporting ATPase (P-type)